ncbi:hypothetical protein LCGC14_0140880 [marine sediment metagenome]|uniref:Uncharacterized protein n=1 Tax=marine sediment metagenome TaxID=412755 RepID=A0A0F9VG98_9ZZZZ
MDLSEYQDRARSTAIYLDIEGSQIIYPALGLVGECGEVAEKYKKLLRDDGGTMTSERSNGIKKELGDCCWYLANICCDTKIDLKTMYEMRGVFIIQRVKKLNDFRLVLLMNRQANLIAECLENIYYEEAIIGNWQALKPYLSTIIASIGELADRLGFTLEEVYTANLDKLARRKSDGSLRGDGDNR